MKIDAPPIPLSHPAPNGPEERARTTPKPDDGTDRTTTDIRGGSSKSSETDGGRLPALVPGEEVVDTSDVHPGPLIPNVNVRSMSARDMADLSFELYANGILSWEEHELLAFQPELNPAYDSTVGALTGKAADPDAPKDHLAIWEERFAFEAKYSPDNRERLYAVRQIVNVMRQLSAPLDLHV